MGWHDYESFTLALLDEDAEPDADNLSKDVSRATKCMLAQLKQLADPFEVKVYAHSCRECRATSDAANLSHQLVLIRRSGCAVSRSSRT